MLSEQPLLKHPLSQVTLYAMMAMSDSQWFPKKLCLIKISMFIFHLWILYKIHLRISTAGKYIGIIKIQHFKI